MWRPINQALRPGEPTRRPELFVGRADDLDIALSEIQTGTNRSLVIAGDRGVGKRSLAEQMRLILLKENNLLLGRNNMWHHQVPYEHRPTWIPLLTRGEAVNKSDLAIHLWSSASSIDVFEQLLSVTTGESKSNTVGLTRQLKRETSTEVSQLLSVSSDQLEALSRARMIVELLQKSRSALTMYLIVDLTDVSEADVEECADFYNSLGGRPGVRFIFLTTPKFASRLIEKSATQDLAFLYLEPLAPGSVIEFIQHIELLLDGACNGQRFTFSDDAKAEFAQLVGNARPDLWHILGLKVLRCAYSSSPAPRNHGFRREARVVRVEAEAVRTTRSQHLGELHKILQPSLELEAQLSDKARRLVFEMGKVGMDYGMSSDFYATVARKIGYANVHAPLAAMRRRHLIRENSISWNLPFFGDYLRLTSTT